MRRTRTLPLLVLAPLLATGCTPVTLPAVRADAAGTVSATSTDPATTQPRDAVKTGQQLYQLQFFQLAVPLGSISTNADFWKPFDETFLGFEQHELLYRNGLRVGRAPLAELRALQSQLDNAEVAPQSSIVGVAGKNVEMELERSVPRQTINEFDAAGRQRMHDFERSDNLFAIGFRQTPRRPDHVYLTIAPAVRSEQARLSVNAEGNVVSGRPFTLYSVGIGLDLGSDECLVIAPSQVALDMSVSIGRTFMMEDRPSARVEKVLVIVPQHGTLSELKPGQALPQPGK